MCPGEGDSRLRTSAAGAPWGLAEGSPGLARAMRAQAAHPAPWTPLRTSGRLSHAFLRLFTPFIELPPSFVSTDLCAGLSIGTAGPSPVGPLLEAECVVMIHTYCSSKGTLRPSKMDFQGRSKGLDDTFQGGGNPYGRSFC